jgi:hypothetical protein
MKKKRKLPTPQPKPMKPARPPAKKSGMTDEERVALSAVTSMDVPMAGEVSVGDMQALIAAAEEGRKKRPAGAKEGPGTKRKPGPRRRRRG